MLKVIVAGKKIAVYADEAYECAMNHARELSHQNPDVTVYTVEHNSNGPDRRCYCYRNGIFLEA